MARPKIYWDSSCFISFLNGFHAQEFGRSEICADVLEHAKSGDVEIWTSAWTIVETIRPRGEYVLKPLPAWAAALDAKDAKGDLLYPKGRAHLETLWNYHERNTSPARLLSSHEATKIKGMFAWPFIYKIQVDPTIAERAAEIARSHSMKAADSLHVASALLRGCDAIHRWDRDFSKTDDLIPSKEPVRISPPDLLTGLPEPTI